MIVHLVFLKMANEANGASGPENARVLVEKLKGLPAKIPELVELEAGTDFSKTPASFDIGLLTKFRSKEDLETYRVHPDHQEVVSFIKETTTERAVVDYET